MSLSERRLAAMTDQRDKAVLYARLWYEIAVALSSEAAVAVEFTRRTGVTIADEATDAPESRILTLPAPPPLIAL